MIANYRKHLFIWFLTLGTIGWALPAAAQFHFFGISGQFLAAPTRGSQVIPAASWLWQFSTRHAIGLEIGAPLYLVNPASQYDGQFEPRYEVDFIWKRRMLPLLTARYRFFLGNTPFVGLAFGAGVINESFIAKRSYQAGSFWQPEVLAVNIIDQVRSPMFRLTAEAGLLPAIGKHMYGLLQAGVGLQVTSPPVEMFGTIDFGEDAPYRIRPYHGKDIFGNFQLGLGIRI